MSISIRKSVFLLLVCFPIVTIAADCPWAEDDRRMQSAPRISTQETPMGISLRDEYFLQLRSIESVKALNLNKKDLSKITDGNIRGPVLQITFNTAWFRFSYKDEKVRVVKTGYWEADKSPGGIAATIIMSPVVAFLTGVSMVPGGHSPADALRELGILGCEAIISDEVVTREQSHAEITLSELKEELDEQDNLTYYRFKSAISLAVYIGNSKVTSRPRTKLGVFDPIWLTAKDNQYVVNIPFQDLDKSVIDAIYSEGEMPIEVVYSPPNYDIVERTLKNKKTKFMSDSGLDDATQLTGFDLTEISGPFLAKVDLSHFKNQALRDHQQKKEQHMLQLRRNLRPWSD